MYALQKFRHYVGFQEFDLITDSRALTALRTTDNLAGKLARWAMFLSEFRINLIHKAGKSRQRRRDLP
jgi:RNase H-like domain found in reverse transcriptase